MRTVKWVDVNGRTTTREEGLSSGGQKATSEVGRERATKKKIYETEAEPAHTAIEDSARTFLLGVSAKVDYAACECPVNMIHFKDTLMFQTRVYR
jgi:hydrocephalus-inducing protein